MFTRMIEDKPLSTGFVELPLYTGMLCGSINITTTISKFWLTWFLFFSVAAGLNSLSPSPMGMQSRLAGRKSWGP